MVILAVVGGGRVRGNTATAVRDLLAGASRVGASCQLEEVNASGVMPIGDCAPCVRDGRCRIDDAFAAIMDRVYEADLLVLGTPLYWYGPSAQLKAFLDRWSCLLDLDEETFRSKMRGKPAVLVLAQGERGFYESSLALQMLEWSLRYLSMPLAGRIVVVGHARGDYGEDAGQRSRVEEAGRKLGRGQAVEVMPPWFHLRHRPGEPLGGIYSP